MFILTLCYVYNDPGNSVGIVIVTTVITAVVMLTVGVVIGALSAIGAMQRLMQLVVDQLTMKCPSQRLHSAMIWKWNKILHMGL